MGWASGRSSVWNFRMDFSYCNDAVGDRAGSSGHDNHWRSFARTDNSLVHLLVSHIQFKVRISINPSQKVIVKSQQETGRGERTWQNG